jgi:hypothetical protein
MLGDEGVQGEGGGAGGGSREEDNGGDGAVVSGLDVGEPSTVPTGSVCEPLGQEEVLSAQPDGVLYVVVCEEWEEYGTSGGFVVWELMKDDGETILTLSVEELGIKRKGRKWVHEVSLLAKGQMTAETNALKDKVVSVRLGLCGERRFAPRVGRAGEMKEIEPGGAGRAERGTSLLACHTYTRTHIQMHAHAHELLHITWVPGE